MSVQGKTSMGLPAQMGIGLAAGVVIGVIWQMNPALDPAWLKPFGDLFIRLIRMVVIPLVFASIVAGAASMGDAAKLGRVALKTLLFYFITTGFAVGLGLFFANLLNPGLGLSLSVEGLVAKKVSPPGLAETLLNIVPKNPASALASGKILQILFFSVMFGFAISAIGEEGKPVADFFDRVSKAMIRLTGMVMSLAPYGVFFLIAYTVGTYGLSVLLPLAKLIAVVYLVCVVHVVVVYSGFVKGYTKISMKSFFRIMTEPMLIAFTTCSSAATLPATMRSSKRLGASESVANFTLPMGATINMDGTAIYLGVSAVFVSQIYGLNLSIAQQATIMLMAVLASIGTAGVPGAGLIMMTMVFTQVGIPMEGIALVAGIDRILDMARTTLNIMGDGTAAVVVSKSEGELGPVMEEMENASLAA